MFMTQSDVGSESFGPSILHFDYPLRLRDGNLHSVLVGIDAKAPSEMCYSTFLDRQLPKRTYLSRNVDFGAEGRNPASNESLGCTSPVIDLRVHREPVMPFDRYSSARLYAGEILLVLGVLVLAAVLVYGQSSTSNATQTVIADSNSNGLNSPGGLAVASDENIFIVDTGNNRVVEEPWNSSTKVYGAQTVLIANLYSPDGVAVSTSGNVFVADTGNNRVVEIPWVRASGIYGPAMGIGSGLNSPHGVAVAANGDLYIADTGNNRVVEVPWDRSKETYGAQTTVGTNLLSPEAVAVGSGGKVYIANVGNSSVVEVPAGCSAATSCTSKTTVASQETNGLANPTGVAVGRKRQPLHRRQRKQPGDCTSLESVFRRLWHPNGGWRRIGWAQRGRTRCDG